MNIYPSINRVALRLVNSHRIRWDKRFIDVVRTIQVFVAFNLKLLITHIRFYNLINPVLHYFYLVFGVPVIYN